MLNDKTEKNFEIAIVIAAVMVMLALFLGAIRPMPQAQAASDCAAQSVGEAHSTAGKAHSTAWKDCYEK